MVCVSSVEAASVTQKARYYEVYWNGLHIGDLIGEIKEEDGHTTMATFMRSNDMMQIVAPYNNIAHGSIATANNRLLASSFEDQIRFRRKNKYIELHYDNDGNIARNTIIPPEDPNKRPTVPMNMLKDSVDPFTAVLLVRKQVRDYLLEGKNNRFSKNIFEGRSLFTLQVDIRGRETIELNKRPVSVIHITLSRQPIAGYTAKELLKMPAQNPVIDVYLEDNPSLLPVRATGQALVGSAMAVLKKECTSIDECLRD